MLVLVVKQSIAQTTWNFTEVSKNYTKFIFPHLKSHYIFHEVTMIHTKTQRINEEITESPNKTTDFIISWSWTRHKAYHLLLFSKITMASCQVETVPGPVVPKLCCAWGVLKCRFPVHVPRLWALIPASDESAFLFLFRPCQRHVEVPGPESKLQLQPAP